MNCGRGNRAPASDGWMPLEPSISSYPQYTLEPLLKIRIAEENLARIDVRFGHELVSFESKHAGGVRRAQVRTTAGEEALTIRSSYLVGCDGGSSTVRKRQLGIALDGRGKYPPHDAAALYRCDSLYDTVPGLATTGRHYKVSDENKSGVVCQDSCRHFSINAENCTDEDMPKIFRSAPVGTPVPFETISRSDAGSTTCCVRNAIVTGACLLAGDSRAPRRSDGRARTQHRDRRCDRSVVEARRGAERLGRPATACRRTKTSAGRSACATCAQGRGTRPKSWRRARRGQLSSVDPRE